MHLAPGTRLGPYEIVGFVGAGGMGEVYRARDSRLDRDVALKVLSAQLSGDADALDRFEREARTLSRLTHPNVCTVYDVGRDGDTRYIVMEFLEGRTLAAHLASGPLAIDRGLEYAIQMADGLAKAHALGVIHRDLKPANVMVTFDGFVKLLDFGLAKRFGARENEATAPMTISGSAIVGTLSYMAPEQTLGAQADVRSDIFSLGVVLYELFSGVRPFDGGNMISTIRRINDEEPRALRDVRGEVPPALETIVSTALQKDPQKRFQSAGELRSHLRAAAGQSGAATSGAVATVARPTGKAMSAAWWKAGIAAAVIVTVVTVVALVSRGDEERAAESVETTSASDDAISLARRGQALLTRFDRPANVDQAIDVFKAALTAEPSSALAHAGIAEAYLRKHSATPDAQWQRLASEHARRAIEINGDLAVSQLAHGMVALRTGRLDEAKAALLRAVDLDPRSPDGHFWLGEFFSVSDPALAYEHFRAAVDVAPDDWRSHVHLGRWHFTRSEYPEAVTAWERALALSADNLLLLRNLGGVYHMLDRVDDAASMFQRSLEVQPNATTFSNLGTLRFFQGRYADAVAAFEKAVEINATYYLYWGNLGDAYRWVPGEEQRAREAYSRAIALTEERLKSDTQDVSLRASLAGYFAKSGNAESALEHIAIIARAQNRQPAVYFKTAIALEVIGRRDEALRDLEVALTGGYALREIANEAELLRLRGDPRYHRMLTRLGK